MRTLTVTRELEKYGLFCEVQARGQVLEIRSVLGDLAVIGTIDLARPIGNPEVIEMAEMDYAEVEARLAVRHCMPNCPVVIEVKQPCPTHEPVEVGISLEEYEKKLDELFQAYKRHAAAEKARDNRAVYGKVIKFDAPNYGPTAEQIEATLAELASNQEVLGPDEDDS